MHVSLLRAFAPSWSDVFFVICLVQIFEFFVFLVFFVFTA